MSRWLTGASGLLAALLLGDCETPPPQLGRPLGKCLVTILPPVERHPVAPEFARWRVLLDRGAHQGFASGAFVAKLDIVVKEVVSKQKAGILKGGEDLQDLNEEVNEVIHLFILPGQNEGELGGGISEVLTTTCKAFEPVPELPRRVRA